MQARNRSCEGLFSVEGDADQRRFKLAGSFGAFNESTIADLRQLAADVAANTSAEVVLDMTRVEMVGAAFVEALVAIARRAAPRRVVLVGLNTACRNVLRVTGVLRLVEVRDHRRHGASAIGLSYKDMVTCPPSFPAMRN